MVTLSMLIFDLSTSFVFFFFNDTATTEIYTLSLHDALPILVIGASTFHTVNGLRLIFTESGIGIGRPGRPDYPYDATSLNYKQKPGIWVALLLAAIAMLYGGMVMFGDVS